MPLPFIKNTTLFFQNTLKITVNSGSFLLVDVFGYNGSEVRASRLFSTGMSLDLMNINLINTAQQDAIVVKYKKNINSLDVYIQTNACVYCYFMFYKKSANDCSIIETADIPEDAIPIS